AEQDAQGRRLAGAVRPEKPGDPAARHAEAEVVDRGCAPKALGQVLDLDHGSRLRGAALDEPVDAPRLWDEGDLERPRDQRSVAEEPAEQALLDLDRPDSL